MTHLDQIEATYKKLKKACSALAKIEAAAWQLGRKPSTAVREATIAKLRAQLAELENASPRRLAALENDDE